MIKRELGLDVRTEVGEFGQFDVLADGTLVASRGGGWLARILGFGWPDEGQVVSDLKKRSRDAP